MKSKQPFSLTNQTEVVELLLPDMLWNQVSDVLVTQLPKPQPKGVKKEKIQGGVTKKRQVHISHLDHKQLHSD